ncbi:MAG TPA: phage holin family protein [Propionicimonas sp.]|nr:phage holin family protein [Propionicimonas sp.]HQA78202.1 phage holin family protein [Propionicimonas sp.]HQD97126.1 phage holin family protein [Propionicimonas sp.]
MIRMLIRGGIYFGLAVVGLLLAALIPGVVLRPGGFLVAVLVFTLAQSLITPLAMRLSRKAGQALIGGMGLISTGLALLVASLFEGGITFDGGALPWLGATLVVWLVTAIGGWLLPLWLLKDKVAQAKARRK